MWSVSATWRALPYKDKSKEDSNNLRIVGLYRLCGSETKKKMLREAFETEPEAVDLSSENVPDINVITSKFQHLFTPHNSLSMPDFYLIVRFLWCNKKDLINFEE